ncbi:MAG: hypothetical protein HKN33_05175 [Pyrinomonadaceae bacterium]|nr:hypothetical protein [Pyrinomonadaceae bacterium]
MRDTIFSHGWYQLAPFSYDESKNRLTFVSSVFGQPKSISVRETEKSIAIESDYPCTEMEVKHAVRHILRLNEPFEDFYEQIAGSGYEWMAKERLGPMLRSPTVLRIS